MLNLKVKHKLLAIWLGSVIFALVLMAGLFQYQIAGLHQQEAHASIVSAVEVLHKELEVTAIRMRSSAQALSGRGDVVASMNLIDRYQDTANYQSAVFDVEKQQLANTLRQHAIATGVNVLTVQDGKGQLAAFYLSPQAGGQGAGYIVFEAGLPRTVVLSVPGAVQDGIPALLEKIQAHDVHPDIDAHAIDENLVLSTQSPINRALVGGTVRPVGSVMAAKVIDADFQTTIQRLIGMEFRLVPPGGHISPPIAGITSAMLNDDMPHLVLDTIVSHPKGVGHTLHSTDDHYVGALELVGHDGLATGFIFALRKDTLENTLTTFQQSIGLVLLFSGLLILPIGVFFLNRTITRPVENLVICADQLRQGQPHDLEAFTGTDEFSELAHAFQDMATAVRAREDALHNSQASLKNAQRIARLGSWEWNIKTGHIDYSDEIHAILGRAPDQVGEGIDGLMACVHADDARTFKRRIFEAIERNAPFVIEHRMVMPDGSERYVIQRGEIHVDDDGGDTRITTMQDITERHMLEQAKSDLISTVSHELRTPLTSIIGTLGLAVGGVMGELPDKLRGMLAAADKNAKRLGALIDDLLDIEKISGGSMHFEFRPLNLANIVRKAQTVNQAYAQSFGASIRIDGDIPDAEIYGDADRLAQVMANLLSNACKFTPKGEYVKIHAERVKDTNTIAISITDPGPGIPEAFEDRIFERFTQADQTLTRQDQRGGTGLGLAITKAIIDMHDGRVRFTTVRAPAPGHGTTFTITLPEWHEGDDALTLTP